MRLGSSLFEEGSQAADFWNVDPAALAGHDQDLAELVERVQSAVAIVVAIAEWEPKTYKVMRLKPTLLGHTELVRAWVRGTGRGRCFAIELSSDGGRNFRNALDFVPEEFRP